MATRSKHFFETHLRSFVKTVSFRAFILLSDALVVSNIVHKESETLAIVVFTNLASTVLYYFHERIWNKFHWLKDKHVYRAGAKAITFRAAVLCSDLLIATTITGNMNIAIGIILVTNLASTILYFIHEQMWHTLTWGKYYKRTSP